MTSDPKMRSIHPTKQIYYKLTKHRETKDPARIKSSNHYARIRIFFALRQMSSIWNIYSTKTKLDFKAADKKNDYIMY